MDFWDFEIFQFSSPCHGDDFLHFLKDLYVLIMDTRAARELARAAGRKRGGFHYLVEGATR